jgi:hypothetical protein
MKNIERSSSYQSAIRNYTTNQKLELLYRLQSNDQTLSKQDFQTLSKQDFIELNKSIHTKASIDIMFMMDFDEQIIKGIQVEFFKIYDTVLFGEMTEDYLEDGKSVEFIHTDGRRL